MQIALLCSKIGRNCKKQEGTISALWNKKMALTNHHFWTCGTNLFSPYHTTHYLINIHKSCHSFWISAKVHLPSLVYIWTHTHTHTHKDLFSVESVPLPATPLVLAQTTHTDLPSLVYIWTHTHTHRFMFCRICTITYNTTCTGTNYTYWMNVWGPLRLHLLTWRHKHLLSLNETISGLFL